jgi:hypothetical protein
MDLKMSLIGTGLRALGMAALCGIASLQVCFGQPRQTSQRSLHASRANSLLNPLQYSVFGKLSYAQQLEKMKFYYPTVSDRHLDKAVQHILARISSEDREEGVARIVTSLTDQEEKEVFSPVMDEKDRSPMELPAFDAEKALAQAKQSGKSLLKMPLWGDKIGLISVALLDSVIRNQRELEGLIGVEAAAKIIIVKKQSLSAEMYYPDPKGGKPAHTMFLSAGALQLSPGEILSIQSHEESHPLFQAEMNTKKGQKLHMKRYMDVVKQMGDSPLPFTGQDYCEIHYCDVRSAQYMFDKYGAQGNRYTMGVLTDVGIADLKMDHYTMDLNLEDQKRAVMVLFLEEAAMKVQNEQRGGPQSNHGSVVQRLVNGIQTVEQFDALLKTPRFKVPAIK